jgi:hypothetical protein
VGALYGVSKKAAVTIVRVPKAIQGDGDPTDVPFTADFRTRTIIDAYRIIIRDIVSKGLNRKAVINVSSSFAQKLNRMPKVGDGQAWNELQAIRALLLFGIPVVVTSGNDAVRRAETLYYCLLVSN